MAYAPNLTPALAFFARHHDGYPVSPTEVADKPSPKVRESKACQSIVIDRPLEQVFAAGCALDRRGEWRRDIVGGEWLGAEIAMVGARCTEDRSTSAGETESWELEVTEFSQDVLLTIIARREPIQVVEHHVFERDKGNPRHTRYTLSLETSGSQVTGGAVQKLIVESLIHFREHVESPRATARSQNPARLRRRVDSEPIVAEDPAVEAAQ